jgi:hypothetical protein
MTISGNTSSTMSGVSAPRDSMAEDERQGEACHLQRMADGDTITVAVAVFYSTEEALTIMPSLGELPARVGRWADLA